MTIMRGYYELGGLTELPPYDIRRSGSGFTYTMHMRLKFTAHISFIPGLEEEAEDRLSHGKLLAYCKENFDADSYDFDFRRENLYLKTQEQAMQLALVFRKHGTK